MKTIRDRIEMILKEMEGPERGKQTRLAEIAGCSRGLINQLLTNPNQKLGYEYAKNIADRMGYRAEWILEGELPKRAGDVAPKQLVPGEVTAKDITRLIELFSESTERGRRFILESADLAEKIRNHGGRVASND